MKRAVVIVVLLCLSVAARAEDIDLRPYAERVNQDRGADIRATAEASILALADSVGVTNRPVAWVELYAALDVYAATQPTQALMIGQRLQTLLLFWTLNGGDAWKVGAPK